MIRQLSISRLLFSSKKPSSSFFRSFLAPKSFGKDVPAQINPKKGNKPYTPLPSFDRLIDEDILEFTNYSFNLQLKSPFRWTPLIQKQSPTPEFSAKMLEFSKRRFFCDDQSFNELIDTLIFEALKGSEFDFYYDYSCLPSEKSRFHGKLPFLLYHKTHEYHLPFVPVIKAKRVLNTLTNIYIDEWNLAEAVGAGLWALDNMKSVDKNNEIEFSRVLHTNGNVWRLYEFDSKGGFKKTGLYMPRNQFKKIYEDAEMQEIVLGLIRYSFGNITNLEEKERELKSVYDYLDEKKYFQRIDDETREKIRRKERFWRFLPKRIRQIFFNE